ncbi:flagellar motor switch phosphatase FliY [Clostridium estertheticum]|uniref:flagellar motor switch phosphatase FliY n=1 Tax=Clostridium estertheticum TaxID=238834 RepID=UPI001CF18608|nr:flagellar motor switch phosphatase FliY [Clostridium estertheticum]MCB2308807.1 flagellar motor switch phosphatase FliY [Clostridium estertheticum]MCB2347115.1 flagellar motor switch phosphatase FliY [Clostridium estertheticum]MCB2351793.1 flagellar motor switch phosphatase FliY [Clostridium estertheticum]WAG44485.1 flagellar motor switch phosphatase FliY [Clostridium estertheticum]
MSNGFLSQEEIDALLNGDGADKAPTTDSEKEDAALAANSAEGVDTKDISADQDIKTESIESFELTDSEKDLLGEVGNISMGSASTALSTIVGQPVNIATPVVTVSTLKQLRGTFEVPNIALDVKFTSGIAGGNLLVIKNTDAAVIASLMMGGDGNIEGKPELSEIELSAVSEAMNQMIGSAATSMATMFAREVNISPPQSKIWDEGTSPLNDDIGEDEQVVQVAFKMTIGTLVDSVIMQVLPIETAKKIVSIMMGTEASEEPAKVVEPQIETKTPEAQPKATDSVPQYESNSAKASPEPEYYAKPIERQEPQVEVRKAAFQPLKKAPLYNNPRNIDLILDVQLEISVVLGKTKKNIRDILNLGTGSLIELDKLAEEPVDILVNGKKVAYGEVVVVDENFGVRITSIISGEERVKTLTE